MVPFEASTRCQVLGKVGRVSKRWCSFAQIVVFGSRKRRRRDIVDPNAGKKRLERMELMLQPKKTSKR